MSTFRRSGSFAAFFYSGKLPDSGSDEFRAALEKHRFRTIENAASEEVSVGWVTPGDPTGDSFEVEDMDGGHAVWLRIRLDKKALPQKWVAIHRAVAERARGRSLSVRERRELKEGLMDQLLPRTLPSVQFVDVLLFAEQRMLLLFATSKGHSETFSKLFFQTFALPLVAGEPYQLALRTGLDRDQLVRLEEVRPVPWPQQGRAPQPVAVREPEPQAVPTSQVELAAEAEPTPEDELAQEPSP